MAVVTSSGAPVYKGPGLQFPTIAWADLLLLDPVAYDGTIVYCPDGPSGGSAYMAVNGSWRPFARGAQAGIVTTQANGEVEWPYPLPYPPGSTIVVIPTPVNAGMQIIDVSLKAAPTVTSVFLKARTTQVLPNLSGFGLLAGVTGALSNLSLVSAAAAGVQIHCLALRAA